jgi:hypothetical protein
MSNLTSKDLNLIQNSTIVIKILPGVNEPYTYPDEDYCLFVNFPHDRLIYPILNMGYSFNCTCSIMWLIQFTQVYINYVKTPLGNEMLIQLE